MSQRKAGFEVSSSPAVFYVIVSLGNRPEKLFPLPFSNQLVHLEKGHLLKFIFFSLKYNKIVLFDANVCLINILTHINSFLNFIPINGYLIAEIYIRR